MKTTMFLTVCLTAAGFAALAPVAGAAGPCGEGAPLADTPFGSLSLAGDGCAGAGLYTHFSACHDAIWGVHTPHGGVGGSDGCEAAAYVVLP